MSVTLSTETVVHCLISSGAEVRLLLEDFMACPSEGVQDQAVGSAMSVCNTNRQYPSDLGHLTTASQGLAEFASNGIKHQDVPEGWADAVNTASESCAQLLQTHQHFSNGGSLFALAKKVTTSLAPGDDPVRKAAHEKIASGSESDWERYNRTEQESQLVDMCKLIDSSTVPSQPDYHERVLNALDMDLKASEVTQDAPSES